jgi:hypothetical protein
VFSAPLADVAVERVLDAYLKARRAEFIARRGAWLHTASKQVLSYLAMKARQACAGTAGGHGGAAGGSGEAYGGLTGIDEATEAGGDAQDGSDASPGTASRHLAVTTSGAGVAKLRPLQLAGLRREGGAGGGRTGRSARSARGNTLPGSIITARGGVRTLTADIVGGEHFSIPELEFVLSRPGVAAVAAKLTEAGVFNPAAVLGAAGAAASATSGEGGAVAAATQPAPSPTSAAAGGHSLSKSARARMRASQTVGDMLAAVLLPWCPLLPHVFHDEPAATLRRLLVTVTATAAAPPGTASAGGV